MTKKIEERREKIGLGVARYRRNSAGDDITLGKSQKSSTYTQNGQSNAPKLTKIHKQIHLDCNKMNQNCKNIEQQIHQNSMNINQNCKNI